MSKRDRILELRQQGYSDRQIAEAVGYKTTSGVRGVASKGKRQAVILQDTVAEQYAVIVEELRLARSEIARLHAQMDEEAEMRLYGHDLGKAWRFEGDTFTDWSLWIDDEAYEVQAA